MRDQGCYPRLLYLAKFAITDMKKERHCMIKPIDEISFDISRATEGT